MKKALLCGLSAALLLALVLVACNKPQADQPDPALTPSAVQTQPEETNEPVNQVEKMSVNTTQQEADTPRLPTEEELLEWFQMSYDFGQIFANAGYSEEEILEEELFRLNGFMEVMDDFRMPDDLEVQYLTWRVLNHGTTTPVSAEQQQQLFTECHQTMYATGTVNIRASYSVNSDKLGTLYRGMSVICIGIGVGEAEGWNMVILESGTTAYMVGSYLSTQRPEMNIVTGGSGGTTQTNTGTGGTGGTGGPGGTGGGLAVDVTGGKSPMDFMGQTEKEKADHEYISENAYLDMSKVGFGN